MRVKLVWTDRRESDVEEEIDSPCSTLEDAEVWAKELLDRFNDEERSMYGEKGRPRTLLRVELPGSSNREHDWRKTSLTTQRRGGELYDAMRCERCGITGKRPGLGGIVLDSKYRAKVYQRCDTAMAHLIMKRGKR